MGRHFSVLRKDEMGRLWEIFPSPALHFRCLVLRLTTFSSGALRGRAPSAHCCLRGQSTVEGAFLIPVILLMLMLLIQPGILLYNRVVMQSAASEGCRLISTRSSGDSLDAYEGYVTRRLGSVPQQKNFHVHEGMCTWEVRFDGGEESDVVTVTIKNQVEPLPFFDFGARSLGLVNEEGNFVQEVSVSARSKSAWVVGNEQGLNPDVWVSQNGSTAERNAR